MIELSALPERTYGLVIGIESYQENSWNVKGGGPAHDALKFTQWLCDCGVPTENIRLCLSPLEKVEHPELAIEEATEQKIAALITDWLSVKKGDLLYLFWAGHGLITSERNRRLLCADATKRNWQNLDLNSLLLYLSSELLNFSNYNLPDGLSLAGQVAYCWRNWQRGNVLLVFDDVKDLEQIEPYLPLFGSQFKVLITTRKSNFTFAPLPLGGLQPDAALELLAKLLGEELVQQELSFAQRLCKLLGYEPLALYQVAGRAAAYNPELRRVLC